MKFFLSSFAALAQLAAAATQASVKSVTLNVVNTQLAPDGFRRSKLDSLFLDQTVSNGNFSGMVTANGQ